MNWWPRDWASVRVRVDHGSDAVEAASEDTVVSCVRSPPSLADEPIAPELLAADAAAAAVATLLALTSGGVVGGAPVAAPLPPGGVGAGAGGGASAREQVVASASCSEMRRGLGERVEEPGMVEWWVLRSSSMVDVRRGISAAVAVVEEEPTVSSIERYSAFEEVPSCMWDTWGAVPWGGTASGSPRAHFFRISSATNWSMVLMACAGAAGLAEGGLGAGLAGGGSWTYMAPSREMASSASFTM